MQRLIRGMAGLGLLSIVHVPFGVSAQSEIELGLPIDCNLGETCWLVNLVDVDPGPGVQDYQCKTRTYDGHKGTDFAIRDLKAMKKGVRVIAAASGVVRGVRNNMPDENITRKDLSKIKGRECGNGLVLSHPQGWETQYCHLRKGSVAVKPGDRVKKGQKLGFVGNSGKAQFPHVHLSVRHNKVVVEPFIGEGTAARCQVGEGVLWDKNTQALLSQPLTAIFNAGFAAVPPKTSGILAGHYQDRGLLKNAPALVFWAAMYNVEAGDRVRIRIFDPDGDLLHSHESTLEKTQVRRILFAGKKRKTLYWDAGAYKGDIRLVRKVASGAEQVFQAERSVLLH